MITPAEPSQRDAQTVDAAFLAAARSDPRIFALYVGRDEETGELIRLAPMHEEWLGAVHRFKRVLIFASPGSGKSALLSVLYVVFYLSRNPNARVVILSASEKQSKRIIRGIKHYIEGSQELREIADGVTFHRLELGEQWAETSITVKRTVDSRDPSVQVFGKGGSVQGSRPDLIIVDDLLTRVNSRTAELREEMEQWYDALIGSRVGPRTRVIAVGNRIHGEDMFHHWAKKPKVWHVYSGSLLDRDGKPTWPERWTPEAIEEKRAELSATEFRRQILCESVEEDEDHPFRRKMFDVCLARGEGLKLIDRLDETPPGCFTVTGVDLATGQKEAAAKTAIFSILVAPDNSRRILGLESGRWEGPEIVKRIADHAARYDSIVVVEDNGSQKFLLDLGSVLAPDMRVVPFTTLGQNKYHPIYGIEGMAFEFVQGRWIIPSRDGQAPEEVEAWIRAWCAYTRLGHTPDILMASWFSREYARVLSAQTSAPPAVYSIRMIGAGTAPGPSAPDPVRNPFPTREELAAEAPREPFLLGVPGYSTRIRQ